MEVAGQAGAALAPVAGALVVAFNGGTSSGRSFFHASLVPAVDLTGPSLIFTYKNTNATTRMVIVTSGRIELIDRPP
jgi:hypothetical protein